VLIIGVGVVGFLVCVVRLFVCVYVERQLYKCYLYVVQVQS